MKAEIRPKEEKGITLIALVITIIVLLILAGVSIVTLTGENGILRKVTYSKKITDEATTIEKTKLEVLASYGEDGKVDLNLLKNNILSKFNYKIKENTFPVIVEIDGYTLQIDQDRKCQDNW